MKTILRATLAALVIWGLSVPAQSEVLELIFLVGEVAFFLWLIAVGVVLLRKVERPA